MGTSIYINAIKVFTIKKVLAITKIALKI